MILCLLYFALLFYLIYTNGFFKLFTDESVSKAQLCFLFLLKSLAIPIFYLVYQRVYGGIDKFDSGKFFHDAGVISDIAHTDLPTYLKILFGLQNDTVGSYDFLLVKDTLNWDNGEMKDFLYNDNRVLIRIHSLVHFISAHSFFVHALFNCFLSFIGIFFFYKTFQVYFKGKEIYLLLLLCLLPALWFYTGAMLKEGLSLFVLGCGLYQIKKLIYFQITIKQVVLTSVFIFLSLLLKPYVLFSAFSCFTLFFILSKNEKLQTKLPFFLGIMAAFLLVLNQLSIAVKHRSLAEAALVHQRIFAGVAKGGIFLYNSNSFIRLPYDTSAIRQVNLKHKIYTIKKDVSYMYWKKSSSPDTQYCRSNHDTLSRYRLAYILPVNHSNLEPLVYSSSFLELASTCYYYTLFYPLFFNAHSILQYLASIENCLVLGSIIVLIWGFGVRKKNIFFPAVSVLFALSLCLLIGIATPNSGAIFRYRSLALIFLLASALYFLDGLPPKIFKRKL